MSTPPPSGTDPERLEDGLARLRELGYLQTPAEAYVAARVGRAGSRRASALAAGIWIGGGGGILVALLLTLSALVSEPGLIERPESLLWLWLDITLVMVVLLGAATALVALGLLRRTGDGVRVGTQWFERPLVWLPGLLSAVYLADRLGRAVLVDLSGSSWILGAASVAFGVGLLGAAVSWSLSGALALARLQGRGVFRPARLHRWERPLPIVVFGAGAFALLAAGPYRALDPLPHLSSLDVPVVSTRHPLLLVAVDGVDRPIVWPSESPRASVGFLTSGDATHPAAYWNELATGFASAEHGLGSAAAEGPRGFDQGLGELREDPILDVLVRQLLPGVGLGRTVAADRRDLRRPPVWEIAARGGRGARVVNWWGSYPAIDMPGLDVVSDRHFLRLHDGRAQGPGLFWPPDLVIEDVAPWSLELDAGRRRLNGYGQGLARITAHDLPPAVADAWDMATGADLYHVARAIEACADRDLIAVHLNGMDIVARALDRAEVDAADRAALRAAQEAYVHDLLARLLGAWPHDTIAVLHGRSGTWTVGPTLMPERAVQWTPWILWSLGVVPPQDMELPSSLRGGPLPSDRPTTYGRADAPDHPDPRSGDDLEQLRSLGYIEG